MKLPKPSPVQNKFGDVIQGSALEKFEDIDAEISPVEQDILIDSVDEYFKSNIITPENIASSQAEKYFGSEFQKLKYQKFKGKDYLYEQAIIKKFGSYDLFLEQTKLGQRSIFNPASEYQMDVTIITKNKENKITKYYKSDNISTYELIQEMLFGLCTIEYTKVNGQPSKTVGTLYKKYILPSKTQERINFLFPLRNDRVGVWDLIKQDWSTFYMGNVFRFVRDDTIGIE